jgi:single-strand DNA-binding protein
MSSVNRVFLIGNLGADPEIKHYEGGTIRTTLNVATHETWKDQKGEKQERTEWHRVKVWGKAAETCATYLSKGSQVCIEGRIQTRKWTDKEGKERYSTEIIADHVTFLSSKKGGARERLEAESEEEAA